MFYSLFRYILLFSLSAAPLAADYYYKRGYKHRHGSGTHLHGYYADPHGRFYSGSAFKDYYRPYQNRWGYSYDQRHPSYPHYRAYHKDHYYKYRHGMGHPVEQRYRELRPNDGHRRFVRWKSHKGRVERGGHKKRDRRGD